MIQISPARHAIHGLPALALGCLLLLSMGCSGPAPVPGIDMPATVTGIAETLDYEPETKTVKHSEMSLEEAINAPGKTVVVDFWAPWCPPCRMLGPELEEVAKELDGQVVIVKVDVDKNSEFAQQFNVSSIPDVRFFKDGKSIGGFGGFESADKIVSMLRD